MAPAAGAGLTPELTARALDPLPDVGAGDDLAGLIATAAASEVVDSDVLVIAHKVVSKAEGRVRALAEIEPGSRALELAHEHGKDARLVQAVLDESASLVRAHEGVLICETHHGFVCANAGVDQSNASRPGELILLPADPDGSARLLRAGIAEALGVRPAVVIADSFGRAWRLGQTDVAIGAAGLEPLDDWSGRPDAYGRVLRVTSIAIADSAAAAADLVRTKDSRRPVVLVRGLERHVTVDDGPGAAALQRAPEQDLFR